MTKGKPLSQAHRFKISQALMGNRNGKGRPKAQEHEPKLATHQSPGTCTCGRYHISKDTEQ